MRTALARLALGLGLLALATGCASMQGLDLLGVRDSLEETQRQYTQMVRWGELERASSFVAEDARDAFAISMPKLRGIRITDYEIGDLDLDDEQSHATVSVVYHGYGVASLIEVRGRERQIWERDAITKKWRVRPDLAEMKEMLALVPDVATEP